jgi:hypothetical protein
MSPEQKAQIACWMDNTHTSSNIDKQGILAFLKYWFPEHFNKPWAQHHHQMTKILWEMFRPDKASRLERQGYFIIHREAAKTTLSSFGFPNYFIWLKGFSPWVRYEADGWEGSDRHDYDIVKLPPIDEPVILILSETATQSEYFVTNIKDNIDTHKGLRRFFGPKDAVIIESEDDEDVGKGTKIWRKNAFRTNDGTMVVGKGAGQQIRGTNFFGKRPHLAFVDDMYSRNNTKTETRLKDLNRWFFAELSNSLDNEKGKLFFLGTIVHPMTVAQQIMGSDQWFGLNKPIIGLEELRTVLDKHCQLIGDKVTIPDKEECKRIQETLTTLSWPEKHTLHYILSLYKREWEQQNIRYFYQEYLNISEAPEDAKFSREKLVEVEFGYDFDGVLTFTYNNTLWKALVDPVMCVDVASSERTTADDSAIAVTAFIRAIGQKHGTNALTEQIFPIILHLEGGRGWGIYEDARNPKFVRPGIVDQMSRISQIMPIGRYYIECNATQENVRREAEKTLNTPVFQIVSRDKKIDRIKAILEPVFTKYPCILYDRRSREPVMKFFTQLLSLNPSGGHDDYPDVVSLAFSKSAVNPMHLEYRPTAAVSDVLEIKTTTNYDNDDNDLRRFGSGAWEVL